LAIRLKPVPREQLCYLFWPDTPESIARRNLSRLLTHLRRALPTPEALLPTNDHIWLDPKRVWSDAATFERLCTISEPERHTEALQQAVDLYQGLLLDGFSLPDSPEFEEWATLERRTFERLYLEALAGLIERRATEAAYDDAITYAQRYLAFDDLAEDVHRRLIELYVETGNRSAALRQYEHCTVVLERELGIKPLPETRAACRTVLEGRVALTPESARTPRPGPDASQVGRGSGYAGY
jgi:DNA-binding SARP family transcriptional activator